MPTDPWTDVLGFTDLSTADRERTLDGIKGLIRDLPDRHPEVFEDEPLTPEAYRRELKDAIFSLGGTLRQEHGADNEDLVADVFLAPAARAGHLRYTDQRGGERIDFKGRFDTGETFAMDVKGGEGQSIGHLLTPADTDYVVLWSERNARNTKPPASRLNEVINRAVRWGFNHDEDVSFMVVRDPPAGARTDDGAVVPDLVVFPETFPTPERPDPPVRDLDASPFPRILFDVLVDERDLGAETVRKHVWYHDLELVGDPGEYRVEKSITNGYDESITLRTRSIDYDRISDIG